MNKILKRLNDNLIIPGNLEFIEYDNNARAITIQDAITVGGYGLIDWEDGDGIVWRTSKVVEKISDKEFKTENSHYTIEDCDDDLLAKLISETKSIEPFRTIKNVIDAKHKPIISIARTETQIKAGYLKAEHIFDEIDKSIND